MDTVQNLNEINRLFKELSNDSPRFEANYDEWVIHRQRTIAVFRKLRDEVDNINVYSGTARAVSSGVSILGGLATIAGFALTFSKNEDLRQLGKKMTKNGPLATIVGGVGATTSSLVEAKLNEKILEEAKKCLENDEQLTLKLMPWLRNVHRLDELFQNVFGCSILTDTWQDILFVFENMMIVYKQGGDTLRDVGNLLSSGTRSLYSDVVKRYNKKKSVDLENISKKIQFLSDKTKFILKEFCDDPNVRKAVQEMYNSFKRSPVALEVFKIGIGIGLELLPFLSTEIVIISAVISTADNAAFDQLNAMYQSILVAVKISRDVLAFLSAVDDICKKKSQYSELLEKAEKILNQELTIMQSAYEKLNE